MTTTERHRLETTEMYDLYPDWGPAKNRSEQPAATGAVQAALDRRDAAGPRPDDN